MSQKFWEEIHDLELAKARVSGGNLNYDLALTKIPLKDKVVLDLGCGFGRNLKYLAQTDAKMIIAYDFPNMLQIAREYLKEEIKRVPGFKFISLPITFMEPPLDGLINSPPVDVVVSSITFQHMAPDELVYILSTLNRFMKDDGLLYVFSRGYLDGNGEKVWPFILNKFHPITSLMEYDGSENHQTVLFRKRMDEDVLISTNSNQRSDKMKRFFHIKDDSVNSAEFCIPDPPLSRSVEISERILRAYHFAEKDFPTKPTDQWTTITNDLFQEATSLLHGNNPVKLASYFQHFGESFMGAGGFTLGQDGYQRNLTEIAALYKDKLICLAEALGVLPFENPEQGRIENSFLNVNDVIDLIEKEMGIDITPPKVCYVLGLPTSRGVIHYRQINALYTAWRLASLLGGQKAVCEIGGGLGLIAFYSRKFGINDYTLLDLPMGNAFAANYLSHAFGEDSVVLYGEKEVSEKIKIFPFFPSTWYRGKEFDLTLNQDGFPEISEILIKGYFDKIAMDTRKYFLSINQESQPLKVPFLLRDDKRFRRVYRSKYWIREGYVEELYEVVK